MFILNNSFKIIGTNDKCLIYLGNPALNVFNDIPSVWWQISTVLIGGATAITVIVAVSAVSACCVTHVIQKSTAKVAGYLQLLAGKTLLIL
ncbi:Uncharacterized protein FWK35_00024520 [Aphis craccivora]|uniref:Uncharacterized protein n=1 Tax=Aphis craccivora TaxID=307492 RepID=A0A6G0ZCG3_APHCR|nr:Uncharacterized protein FWK35_00024520 [Aphis craccivora]